MEINFINTYTPKSKNLCLLCLKQGQKKDGIYFFARDMIIELSKNNSIVVFGNQEFLRDLPEETLSKINSQKIPSFTNRWIKWIYLLLFLPFKIKTKKPLDEIVFTTEDLPVVSLVFLKKVLFPSSKINMVVHDLAEYFISRYSPVKDFYRRVVIKKFIYLCDEIITVSEKTKSDIVSLGFKNEEFIKKFYNQVELKEFTSLPRIIDSDYILYVAGFDFPSKNHWGLINMYKELKKRGFKHNLVLAGNSELNSSNLIFLENKVKELDLDSEITFYKNITNDELSSLYEHCEYTVFPSLYEGFGRPIIESLRYNKKVFCADVGIYRELSSHPLIRPLNELGSLDE